MKKSKSIVVLIIILILLLVASEFMIEGIKSKIDYNIANNENILVDVKNIGDESSNDKSTISSNLTFLDKSEILLETDQDTNITNSIKNVQSDDSQNNYIKELPVVSDNSNLETKDIHPKNNNDNTDKISPDKIDIDEINTDKVEIVEKNKKINKDFGLIISMDIETKKSIKLVDKSNGICAQAIEYFYEDDNYRYYFTCIMSNSIYVIINKQEYLLVEALNNKIVTIEELEQNGYTFKKESKNLKIS